MSLFPYLHVFAICPRSHLSCRRLHVFCHCLMQKGHMILQVSLLEFSRDRKMMSVLCSRKQQEIMFSKGAPESIISRCTNILCNDDGSVVPLTTAIRAELESRFHSVGPMFSLSSFLIGVCLVTNFYGKVEAEKMASF